MSDAQQKAPPYLSIIRRTRKSKRDEAIKKRNLVVCPKTRKRAVFGTDVTNLPASFARSGSSVIFLHRYAGTLIISNMLPAILFLLG